MFVKQYAPLVAMLLLVVEHFNKIGMDTSETIFKQKVAMTLTFDPKINRVHLLVMTNKPTKYEVPGSKRSQVIDRKPFFQLKVALTLTFDPVTPKSIGFIYWS